MEVDNSQLVPLKPTQSTEILPGISDVIFIDGLEFYGFHGVPDAERIIGHRYVVDTRLYVDTRLAAHSDDVVDTVNYAEVAALIIGIGTGDTVRLLECLIDRMAQTILTQFVQVQAVNLRVRKMLPPMNAIVASVGIEIIRRRIDGESVTLNAIDT